MTLLSPNCCCCETPTATCRRYATGGDYGTGYFEYSVAGATYAEIYETCSVGYPGPNSYPIALSGGAASGVFSGVRSGCEYEIRVTNQCGTTTVCSDICATPYCKLTVTRVPDALNPSLYESVKVEWEYKWIELWGTPVDPVVTATLNGADVFQNDQYGSGTEFYYDPDDLPSQFVLVITNDCGKQVTCTFNVPCCWRVDLATLSVSGITSVSRSCGTLPTCDPQYEYLSHSASYSVTGLGSLNGTYTAVPDKFTCSFSTPVTFPAGSASVVEKNALKRRLIATGQIEEWDIELQYTVNLFVKFHGSNFTIYGIVGPEATLIRTKWDNIQGSFPYTGPICICPTGDDVTTFLFGPNNLFGLPILPYRCPGGSTCEWNPGSATNGTLQTPPSPYCYRLTADMIFGLVGRVHDGLMRDFGNCIDRCDIPPPNNVQSVTFTNALVFEFT